MVRALGCYQSLAVTKDNMYKFRLNKLQTWALQGQRSIEGEDKTIPLQAMLHSLPPPSKTGQEYQLPFLVESLKDKTVRVQYWDP